jgi:hypothetical protein
MSLSESDSDSTKSKSSNQSDTDSVDSSSNSSKSSDNQKVKSTKGNDEFVKKVKEYIKVDDLIKEKSELVKEKKELETFLLEYLKNKKMDSINVGTDTIKRVQKDKKDPINKKEIKNKLLNDMKKEGLFKNDGQVKSHTNGNELIQSILEAMDKRPVTKVYKLERKGDGGKGKKK